jgi:hypothetical protein
LSQQKRRTSAFSHRINFCGSPACVKPPDVASNVRRPHNHDNFKVIGGLSADELLSEFVQNINNSSFIDICLADSPSLTFRKTYHGQTIAKHC